MVLDILRAMRKFYSTKLSAADSKVLGAGSATNADDRHMFEGISKVSMFDPPISLQSNPPWNRRGEFP